MDTHTYCKKQRAFAWAKYYEEINNGVVVANSINNLMKGIDIPQHITTEFITMADELKKMYTCPVCLEFVNKETIQITYCGHIYCKPCLDHIKTNMKKCAICRKTI